MMARVWSKTPEHYALYMTNFQRLIAAGMLEEKPRDMRSTGKAVTTLVRPDSPNCVFLFLGVDGRPKLPNYRPRRQSSRARRHRKFSRRMHRGRAFYRQ
jgi:hypothetical protein